MSLLENIRNRVGAGEFGVQQGSVESLVNLGIY